MDEKFTVRPRIVTVEFTVTRVHHNNEFPFVYTGLENNIHNLAAPD
jgi:hypothetical protein